MPPCPVWAPAPGDESAGLDGSCSAAAVIAGGDRGRGAARGDRGRHGVGVARPVPTAAWLAVRGSDSVVAGVSAALAMVPIGLVVSATGFEVNRYGRLVAVVLTGSDRGVVLLALFLPALSGG